MRDSSIHSCAQAAGLLTRWRETWRAIRKTLAEHSREGLGHIRRKSLLLFCRRLATADGGAFVVQTSISSIRLRRVAVFLLLAHVLALPLLVFRLFRLCGGIGILFFRGAAAGFVRHDVSPCIDQVTDVRPRTRAPQSENVPMSCETCHTAPGQGAVAVRHAMLKPDMQTSHDAGFLDSSAGLARIVRGARELAAPHHADIGRELARDLVAQSQPDINIRQS
jgi:hypothetical protein